MSSETNPPRHEPATVLDRISDAVVSVDAAWRVGYANEAATDVLGCRHDAIEGADLWDACPALTGSAVETGLRAAVESGDPLTVEGYLDPAGSRVSARAYPTDDGLTLALRPVESDDEPSAGEGRPDLEVQFQSLVRGVEEYAIFVLEPDGTVATWNEGARKIKGYEAGEIVGEHFSVFYTEADVAEGVPAENLRTAITEGQVVDEGWRVRADGSGFWANVTITPVYEGDTLRGFTKVTRDMTDRREREERLRRERDFSDRLLEAVPVAVTVVDADGEVVQRNRRAGELLSGGSGEASGGLTDRELYDESGEPVPHDERPYPRVRESGEPVSDWHCRLGPDEGSRWVSVNAIPLFDGSGSVEEVVLVSEDITALKRRERELERDRDRFRSELAEVFTRVSDAFFALDDEFRFTYANEQAAELIGHPVEELEGECIWEVFPEAVDTRFQEAYERAMDRQETVTFVEHYPPLDSWFEVNAYPSESGLSVYFDDVTERRRRERELERYRTIVETMNDGVYVVDGDGRFTMVNGAYAELTGRSGDELLGSHVSSVVDEETIEHARTAEERLTAGESDSEAVEAPIERPDGSTIEAEARFAMIPGDAGERLGVVRDITDRKRRERELEQRLRQQELIADLGRRALEGTDPDDLFDETVTAVADVLGADYCEMLELDTAVDELLLRAGSGWEEGYVGTATVETGAGSLAGYTLLTEEPVVVEDLDTDTRFSDSPLLTDHEVGSGITVVIGTPDDPWGVLGVHDTTSRAFDEHAVSFVQSMANVLMTAIDRQEYVRTLKRFEVFTEESTDVNAILAADGTVRYATPSVEPILGYTPTEVVGEDVLDIVHPDDREEARAMLSELVETPETTATMELRLRRGDGEVRVMEVTARNLLDDPHIRGLVTYTRDVTERERRERTLRDQRDQLGALAGLNAVVRDVNTALVESSNRDELERQVCERLAGSESYAFAWIGELDPSRSKLRPRTSAGPHDILEGTTVRYDEDGDCGPACRAVRTGEMQVVGGLDGERHAGDVPDRFESHAALPLVHGERDYGVLNVYSVRENAFDEREREVVAQLGGTIAHAITALERKEALVNDTVTRLEFDLPGVAGPIDGSTPEGQEPPTISLERTIRTGRDHYLLYLSVEGLSEEDLVGFLERSGSTDEVRRIDEADGTTLYEVRLDDPPFLSTLTEYSGSLDQVRVTGDGLSIRAEFPVEVDVRDVVESVQEVYPGTTLVRQGRVERERRSRVEFVSQVSERLTEKQYQTLETAYFAGYYDWPRRSSAGEVADALSISDSTISQHFRSGHRKLCAVLFEE